MSKQTKTNSTAASHGGKSQSSGRFDFIGKAKYFVGFSIISLIWAIFSIGTKGFDYGIDFIGGTEIQLKFEQTVDAGNLRKFLADQGFPAASVQGIGDKNEFLIRMETREGKDERETTDLLNATVQKVTEGLTTSFSQEKATVLRVDTVGPQVGDEMKKNAVLAMFYSLFLILIYIGLRFEYKFAPSAVFCLFHDALFILGIFAAFDREVNIQTLAAVLTLIGYSLNDTIIVYDRVRENMKFYRDMPISWIFNRSLNDTLSRTILTVLMTFFATASLYVFADGVIKDFAFTLGIGLILGTYSTIYVASPLVILFDKLTAKSV